MPEQIRYCAIGNDLGGTEIIQESMYNDQGDILGYGTYDECLDMVDEFRANWEKKHSA